MASGTIRVFSRSPSGRTIGEFLRQAAWGRGHPPADGVSRRRRESPSAEIGAKRGDAEASAQCLRSFQTAFGSGTPCSRTSRRRASQDVGPQESRVRSRSSQRDLTRSWKAGSGSQAAMASAATSQPPRGASTSAQGARALAHCGGPAASLPRHAVEGGIENGGQPLVRGKRQRPRRARAHDRRQERADRQLRRHARRRTHRPERGNPDQADAGLARLLGGDPRRALQDERWQPVLPIEDGRAVALGHDLPLGGGIELTRVDPLEPAGKRRDAKVRGTRRIEPEQMGRQRRGPRRRHAHPGGQLRCMPSQVVQSNTESDPTRASVPSLQGIRPRHGNLHAQDPASVL